MSFKNATNCPIDVISALLMNSTDRIIGIRIPYGDPSFTPDAFKDYIEEENPSMLFMTHLDIRGPFADNFVTTSGGKPRSDIFYIGVGTAIQDRLAHYLESQEGTPMEKASGMFAAVLKPYPVYTLGFQYTPVRDATAHAPKQEQ